MPLQIGIVGARRRAQGIGQHVARHLASLGAEVTAIVGTSSATVDAACAALRAYGIAARGYLSLAEMLLGERLDAVAICSPYECHREQLLTALSGGVHVLCEKPLVFNAARDPWADARPVVEGFAAAGLVLMVNEQWPYTLDGFRRLHPSIGKGPPAELEVTLSPDAMGPEMIPNSMPHAVSLLLALVPGAGAARDITVRRLAGNGNTTAAEVQFTCDHPAGTTQVRVLLRRVARQPRPAGYAIDGRGVRRVVELPEYRMYFEADSDEQHEGKPQPRRVELEDPLRLLLMEFLRRCETAKPLGSAAAPLLGLQILRDVYAVARDRL